MVNNLGVSHLRCIVAVADCQSFTAAAASLNIGQSSLSRTVAEAERRLNVRLFTRTTRNVEVTGDGREVSEYARRMLAAFDDGLRDIEGFLTGDRGSVTVACLPSIAATFLPPHVVAFRETHPDVRLHIKDGLLETALTAVSTGAVDLAIVATSGALAGLQQERIGLDSFYCAVPRTHRFATQDYLEWADLSGEPFIAFGPDSSIERPVRRALEDAEVELGPVVQAQNVGAVAGLVAAGLGITAVPELVLPMISFAGLAHIPLRPTVQRKISIVQLAGRRQSSCTQAFIESIRKAPSVPGAQAR
jgi:LysR family carnitine catabolism transcriptional activator